jgi:hypothetical protein
LFQSLPLELTWLLGLLPAPLRAIEATLHKHAPSVGIGDDKKLWINKKKLAAAARC